MTAITVTSPVIQGIIRAGYLPSAALSLWSAYKSTRRTAPKRGIPFLLTEADLVKLAEFSGPYCGISRLPFRTLDGGRKYDRQPWAPSIDRINCDQPYEFTNCRLVCVAANLAMNTWGEAVLQELSVAVVRRLEGNIAKSARFRIA